MSNVIVTAGGTTEYIDTVRKITNSGTGRLGAEIADKLASKHRVFYIHAKGAVKPNIFDKNIEAIEIVNVNDLKEAVSKVLTENNIDWFVHTMAVSDYSVDYVSSAEKMFENLKKNGLTIDNIVNNPLRFDANEKISSQEDNLIIKLKKTPKIIDMIKPLSPKTRLIGFKLMVDVSPEELIETAWELQKRTHAEYIVTNDLNYIKNGRHKAFICDKVEATPVTGKSAIASAINQIINQGVQYDK